MRSHTRPAPPCDIPKYSCMPISRRPGKSTFPKPAHRAPPRANAGVASSARVSIQGPLPSGKINHTGLRTLSFGSETSEQVHSFVICVESENCCTGNRPHPGKRPFEQMRQSVLEPTAKAFTREVQWIAKRRLVESDYSPTMWAAESLDNKVRIRSS